MKDNELGVLPVIPLIWKLAVPAMIAQAVTILYNITDRIFIGRLSGAGTAALTALGVCFPVTIFIAAAASLCSSGGAAIASVELGRGELQKAERILGQSVLMLLFFSVVLTALLYIFTDSVLNLFGASPDTIGYARDYLRVYLWGTAPALICLGLNMLAVAQGGTKTAMISVIAGAFSNIVLDALALFVLDMGISGAAAATVISQIISAVFPLRFLLGRRASIRLRIKALLPELAVIKRSLALGVSPFIMQASESVTAAVFNAALLARGGDLYVGSMTVLQSVMQFSVVAVNGFTAGVQPILSFNYGKKLYSRCRRAAAHMLVITSAISVSFCLLAVFAPAFCAQVFTGDDELIALSAAVLPVYFAGRWMYGIQSSAQTVFLALGQAKKSLLLAVLRKLVLLIPLILLLPRFFGVMGIYWAEPAADIISAAVAGLMLLLSYKKLLPKA